MEQATLLKKDKIYNHIKRAIINNEFLPGEKLPRELDFAKSLSVGVVTLRDSLKRLESEGYIKRLHGKGTFVNGEDSHNKINQAIILLICPENKHFEDPVNYILPGIIRQETTKNFKVHSISLETCNKCSSADMKKFIKSNNVIGIIAMINTLIGNEPIISKLRSFKIPVVMPHCSEKDVEISGFHGITVDKKQSWCDAISYLTECGHKKLALLGDNFHKYRGYSEEECVKLLESHNISRENMWFNIIELKQKLISDVIDKLFSQPNRPTAILCFSDFVAIYVYEALKNLKLRIPADVAVMGICGYPDAHLLTPALSTMDYCYAESGEMAVEMILDPPKWLSGDKPTLRSKSGKLRKRKSTAIKL